MPDLRRIACAAAAMRIALMLALAGLAAPLAPGIARAQEADSFLVRDVHVDVTAENVNIARDQAFAQGQRFAFEQLVRRFAGPDEAAKLNEIGDTQLNDLVLDVGVDQEKRSTVRYIATLSVRFRPDMVRELLHAENVAFAEWRGRPLVVLPVLKTENGPVLWDTINPWRDAWYTSSSQGLVPISVPRPKADNQLPGDALQAATADAAIVGAFARRFDAQDLMIATAVVGADADGHVALDVNIAGAGPLVSALLGTRSWTGEAGETPGATMRRAVADVAAMLNDAYRAQSTVPQGESASLAVMVPLDGFADWTHLRERLVRTPAVRGWEVAAISQSSASLVLHYLGDQNQLESAFVQTGLVLSWADDHWLLQNQVAKPPAVSTPAATPAPAPSAAAPTPAAGQ